jgi:hypothetical protein
MSALQDHLKAVARDVVSDIEKAAGEALTTERRARATRAAETLLAYPFVVVGVTGADLDKVKEQRALAASVLANTSMAIVIDGRAAVEKIVRDRLKQVLVIILNVAGIAVKS